MAVDTRSEIPDVGRMGEASSAYRPFLIGCVLALAACGDNTNPKITIEGTVAGLEGSGLVLRNNGGDDLAIAASGAFAFATPLAAGTDYAVTVATQPSTPAQTCTVVDGSGTASVDGVTDIAVTCKTGVFAIGGTVSGLTGTGLVLQNNGRDDLTISANGAFTFATPLASGTAFAVTVQTQPSAPTQTCTVSGASGTIGNGPVTTVVVDCAVDRFTVGGIVAGLAGTVVLQNNAGDDITISANGSFAFPTTVASGATYAVTVRTQPATPRQTCVVTSASGSVTNANITSVRVTCTTNTFTVGGMASGLAGTGLVLQNNGGDNLSIAADGSFTFTTPVASGASYAVTVLTQPTSPTQVCTVTNGSGTVGGGAVTNVQVTCVTRTFTVGGTVSGLAGTGLVLRNNGGDDLAITANGAFTFVTPVASGAMYAVTVATQPSGPTQTCTVSGGSGTVGAGNVTSVAIDCTTNSYTVGGTISGLAGTVVLQNNGGDNLMLTANGSFAFATPIASGATYTVTVFAQPTSPSQTCTVTNGTGSVIASDITSVTVTCVTNRFTVGGSVSGLGGAGLVLQNNGGDDLAITANGTFTFATSVPSGMAYGVTVLAQPTSPSQTCVVANASGVIGGANVTNVTVTCTTDTFLVGGTVSGLAGGGLVLRNNGGDDLSVSANGTFSFATRVASGGTYAASVFAQPTSPSQTCVVTNGSGTVTNANITSITVTCTTDRFSIGGTVSGLAGGGLVLHNNGGDNLAISANGSFTFATPVASGATFAVTVFTEPSGPTQTCVVSGGTGTVGGGPVTSVVVDCTTNRYAIGGTASGLAGTVVLQNNGGDNLTLTANGTFAFATTVASGATYAVTVLAQPTSPSQTCVVSAGSGTVGGADVTNVVVTCTTNRFTVGGTLSGLAGGQSVVLRNNGADDLTVSANGGFVFATTVPSGSPYSVTVLTQPSSPVSQTCTVTNGSGMIGGANVTNVAVTCTTNRFTVGGTVSGLTGVGLVVRNNGGDDLSITANGSFTFATSVASGAAYAVTILTQPSGQSCTVANGSGTIGGANITNVSVVCSGFIYQSATMGLPGQTGGFSLTSSQFLGVRFTTTQSLTITSLGGHYQASSGTHFVAIVPIDTATNLPFTTTLSDAVGFVVTTFPASSAEVTLPTSFTLPAGSWAIIVGSGRFGASGFGAAPSNNTDIGTPGYFFFNGTGWQNGGFSRVRMFVKGG